MGVEEVGGSIGDLWIEGVEVAATEDLLRFGGILTKSRIDLLLLNDELF